MALTQATINWNAKEYIRQVREALDEVVKYGAEMTAEDAKRNLERAAPDSTGTLASQIEVAASRFEDGGWIVAAQGRGSTYKAQIYDPNARWDKGHDRYYASFVELGSVNNEPVGYLRRALRRNRYRMRAKLAKALDAIVR